MRLLHQSFLEEFSIRQRKIDFYIQYGLGKDMASNYSESAPASVILLHRLFSSIVEKYHPLAEYIGFQDTDEGIVICYRGMNEQYMLLDDECNIVTDTTLGTSRSAGLFALGLTVLQALTDSDKNRY